MLIIGSHVSCSGKEALLQSVKETIKNKANALMIFAGPPQNARRKALSEMKIKEAHLLMKQNNLSFKNFIVHAPYIINLASEDKEKEKFAVEFLIKEIKRSFHLGASQIVLHPGNNTRKDMQTSIQQLAFNLNYILKETEDFPVKIALETMAGKGSQIGKTFEEIQKIISLIKSFFKKRISVCFDTCHVHDAGYDLINNYKQTMILFDQIIGLSLISVLHINDSKNISGAKKDRHENIGFGKIGFTNLLKIIYDPVFENIPKILETPFVEKQPIHKQEIEMIKNKNFENNLKEIKNVA